MISNTPRYDKDYRSFSNIEMSGIRMLRKVIIKNPVPPETDHWKTLHQFDNDYPEGYVCAMYINYSDRLVYELNSTTGDITFTNCRGHKYRGKSYSELIRTFSIAKSECDTVGKKLAFNKFLNDNKFKL